MPKPIDGARLLRRLRGMRGWHGRDRLQDRFSGGRWRGLDDAIRIVIEEMERSEGDE